MKRKARIPWGSEKKYGKMFTEEFREENCPDCATIWGSYHNSDTKSICDVEECPYCGSQLLSCGHKRKLNLPRSAPGQLVY